MEDASLNVVALEVVKGFAMAVDTLDVRAYPKPSHRMILYIAARRNEGLSFPYFRVRFSSTDLTY